MQRHRSLATLGAALALTLLTPRAHAQTPPAQAVPAVDLRTRFNGTFNFVGGQREREAVTAAIERATHEMNFIIGPIARGRLRDRNPIYPAIAFRFPTGLIHIVLAGRTWAAADNGTETNGTSSTGDAVRVREFLEGDHLVQVIRSDEGQRRNVFSLSADGTTLTMRVTVASPRLPQPLTYSLTYRR